jgi:tRNA(Ile)-lysidine synthase
LTRRALREIARSWRDLTDGRKRRDDDRRTLLAVSGGADSSAMALALVAAVPGAERRLVIGHVVHDMRPSSETQADLRLVQEMGAWIGVPVLHEQVRVTGGTGNVEARARTQRYAQLRELARQGRCQFVASAHHADDVLETMLMRLVRGAGPRGMACVAPARDLGDGVTLVRPMLMQTRATCEAICDVSHWEWASDATNHDLTFARAKIRAQVLPVLHELRPSASRRATQAALLMRQVSHLVATDAAELLAQGRSAAGYAWSRAFCRNVPQVVMGEALRLAFTQVSDAKHDRLSQRTVAGVLRAVHDSRQDRRDFTLGAGNARLHVRVEALTVTIHHEA